MKKHIVNGVHIVDFRSMCDAFGTAVSAPNGYFGRDLQTFDDCLFDYVAFVKPCEFVWLDSNIARVVLDYKMLADYCHQAMIEADKPNSIVLPEGRKWITEHLSLANSENKSMFDVVVEFIESVSTRSSGRVEIALTLQ